MKKQFVLVVFFLLGSIYMSASADNGSENRTTVINNLDSVIFDLENATLGSGYVDVPVYIITDDTINALDFSMKFNESKITYNSAINLTTYISPLGNFNASTRVLYFTSFSSTNYEKNKPLVAIRFNLLYGPLCITDFNTITAYLNGDVCSYRFTGCFVTTTPDAFFDRAKNFLVYPNPARNILHVEVTENVRVDLMDLTGRRIEEPVILGANEHGRFNVGDIAEGIYILKMSNNRFSATKKVVISR